MPEWAHLSKRKIKAYAVFGAMTRILANEVEKSGNDEASNMFHDLFGDVNHFDEVIYAEILRPVQMLEKQLEKNTKSPKMPILDLFPAELDFDELDTSSVISDDAQIEPETCNSSFSSLFACLQQEVPLVIYKLIVFSSYRGQNVLYVHPQRVLSKYGIKLPSFSTTTVRITDEFSDAILIWLLGKKINRCLQ